MPFVGSMLVAFQRIQAASCTNVSYLHDFLNKSYCYSQCPLVLVFYIVNFFGLGALQLISFLLGWCLHTQQHALRSLYALVAVDYSKVLLINNNVFYDIARDNH